MSLDESVRVRGQWDELLDQMARALDDPVGARCTCAVQERHECTELGNAFAPPDDLPPLPQHLLERARELIDRQQQKIAELSAERDRVGAEIDRRRRAVRSYAGSVRATGSALSL